MNKNEYRIAIIGCGGIARSHATGYQRNPRTKLVACMDINPANMEKIKTDFNVPHGYTDYIQLLKEQKPDVVTLCTYMGSHFEMMLTAIEHGVRAFICEKPFLSSAAEIKKIKQLVQRYGLKIIVPHGRRYGGANIRARELFLGGDIGDPVMVTGILGNADLVEMGSHWFDLCRFYNGDPKVNWVLAQTEMGEKRQFGHAIENISVALYEFENGVRGVFDSNRSTPDMIWNALIGTKGSILIKTEEDMTINTPKGQFTESHAEKFPECWKKLGLSVPNPWWDYKWDVMFDDFVQWLDGTGAEPCVGFSSAIVNCEMGIAGYLSALHGRRIELPLSDSWLLPDEFPGETLQRKSLGRS